MQAALRDNGYTWQGWVVDEASGCGVRGQRAEVGTRRR